MERGSACVSTWALFLFLRLSHGSRVRYRRKALSAR